MNVVGKILVVLNLLFALVVGGFLLIDYGIRTNWKKENDTLRRELEVARVNLETLKKTSGLLNNEVTSTNLIASTEKEKLNDAIKTMQAKYQVMELQIAD